MKLKAILIILIGILVTVPSLRVSGDAPLTFSVRNNTDQDIGIVSLNHPQSSPDSLEVNGYGTYATQVEEIVPSVTINGQVVSYPNSATVTLPSGVIVRVDWESPVVVIVDQNEL